MTKPWTHTQLWDMANRRGLAVGPRPVEKVRKPRNNEESRNQIALFNWWSAAHNGFKLPLVALYAIPNGGKRGIVTASIMKKEGQRSGVCDIFLMAARGIWHGLYVEMKAKNGVVSPAQKEFMRCADALNYRTTVCRSWEEAAAEITRYLTNL